MNHTNWSLGVAYLSSCPPKKVLSKVKRNPQKVNDETNYLKKRPIKPTGRHEEDVLSGTADVGVADTTHADVVSKAKYDVTRGGVTLAVVCSVVTLALLVLHPN